MLPWKSFVNMISRMAKMHLVCLFLRQLDLQLLPQNLILTFDSNLWLFCSSSTLFQAGFDNILTFLLNNALIAYFLLLEETMKMRISF